MSFITLNVTNAISLKQEKIICEMGFIGVEIWRSFMIKYKKALT